MSSQTAPQSNNASAVNPGSVDSVCGWTPLQQSNNTDAADLFIQVDLVLFPFFLGLSTFGNILNLIVLLREKSFGGKNAYLVSIAIIDTIYMWCALWSYTINYDQVLHDGALRPSLKAAFDRVAGLVMFLQETAVFSSSWLIIAFSMERLLAIRFPLRYLTGSNLKRTAIIIATIIAVAVLLTCFRLVDYYWFYDNFLRLRPRPKIRPPRPYGLMIWSKAYTWGQVFIQVFTFLAILIVNTVLLLTIFQQRKRREKKLQAVSSKEKAYAEWYALPMLAACVILYLATQFPGFIDNLTYLLEKTCTFQRNPNMQAVMRPLQNIAMNINFSVNFLLYCGVSAKFRDTVKKMMVVDFFRSVKRRLSEDSNKSITTVIRNRTKASPVSL
ncbi:probable G-protein coupled receptor 139 [Paramacrobiotus metropolitanus]|uniref:probable G-protein coupled receptor 139 n=1 Tax=Paramacrobiotus metropolitanus TaxID=2943436 RepID=UPI00244633AF|nr:probable G-protein coupled receptor 139 [Paramacrobiotus metropolitanus]